MKHVLITGANGEIGHGLIQQLAQQEDVAIYALDLHPLDPALQQHCALVQEGDITDPRSLTAFQDVPIDWIFHLAAILSTSAEKQPETAHRVNIDGMLNILTFAQRNGQQFNHRVTVLFPSSIAVYGIPSLAQKHSAGPITEDQWVTPITMYGANKVYSELLGRYYSDFYRLLDPHTTRYVDFRSVRFPGIISAFTLPTGGTSDYAPEMLHAAAQGKPYACFVREDTIIPFMVMPDAVNALLWLAQAPGEQLTRRVYNVQSFSFTAQEFADKVRQFFPDFQITFDPDPQRQRIVDSWPAAVDDSAARRDWNWHPHYDVERAFTEYLIPNIRRRYATATVASEQ